MDKKDYKSYKEYLKHQKKKNSIQETIDFHKTQREKIIKNFEKRFRRLNVHNFFGTETQNKRTLSIGARYGQEVQGLINCGYKDSVGIDIAPLGGESSLVKKGDAHALEYESSHFDIIYSNILDHLFDVRLFLRETERVLRVGGYIILDVGIGARFGPYESMSISSDSEITDFFQNPNYKIVNNQKDPWVSQNIEKALNHNITIKKQNST